MSSYGIWVAIKQEDTEKYQLRMFVNNNTVQTIIWNNIPSITHFSLHQLLNTLRIGNKLSKDAIQILQNTDGLICEITQEYGGITNG